MKISIKKGFTAIDGKGTLTLSKNDYGIRVGKDVKKTWVSNMTVIFVNQVSKIETIIRVIKFLSSNK